MRTKEEILDEIEKDEITVYKNWVEVLIDIRDILDESRNEYFGYTFPEKKTGGEQ